MIKLAKGRDNSVMLKVSVAESLESFSANLMICGTVKKIEKLSEAGDRISFTASEIDTALAVIGEEHFGTLLISDSGGNCRLKAQPQVNIVDDGECAITASDQLICCSLPNKMVIAPDSGGGCGGDTPDLSNYVTKTVLNNAKAEVKQYTDDQISNVGTTIIMEQPVTIIDKDGNPKQMTVQESMQNVVVVQSEVAESTETINRISEKADSASKAAAGAVEAASSATEAVSRISGSVEENKGAISSANEKIAEMDAAVKLLAERVDEQGEAVQKTAGGLEEVKETVSEIAARYMSAEVKDEDNDGQPDAETLYINKGTR